jgi:hypothetical protein
MYSGTELLSEFMTAVSLDRRQKKTGALRSGQSGVGRRRRSRISRRENGWRRPQISRELAHCNL